MLAQNKSFIIWLFGMISGFTIMVSGNTLNYWLASKQIDLRTIGIFAFISIPYAINFIWAPVFDTKRLGWLSKILGNRISWICVIQLMLSFSVYLLSKLNPNTTLYLFGITGLVVSFLSSAQDTILGALRTEIIPRESQGAYSGIYIFGYRIGMLISGFGAIYLSEYLSWGNIYKIFSVIILIFLILLIATRVDQDYSYQSNEKTLYATNKGNFLLSILKPIGSYSFIVLIVIFLVLYRLPDNFINIMINPFLIHLGYSSQEIATTGKFFGIVTSIIGGLLASLVMRKKNILDSLLIFGVFHALAHSMFIVQELYGKNLQLLVVVIAFESITGGMTMAAYIAFIASICQGKFRATQYSFFSSMMGVSRSVLPAISGYIVIDFGWRVFFSFVTIATLPSLFLAFKISKKLKLYK